MVQIIIILDAVDPFQTLWILSTVFVVWGYWHIWQNIYNVSILDYYSSVKANILSYEPYYLQTFLYKIVFFICFTTLIEYQSLKRDRDVDGNKTKYVVFFYNPSTKR